MIIAGIAILYAWVAAVFAAAYACCKYVLRLFGKQAGTHRRHNESTG